MRNNFIANSVAYLDPAQLRALGHVSRETALITRDRCECSARLDVDPDVKRLVSDCVNRILIDANDLTPEHPRPIRDMRLIIFQRLMTRALSRSSFTMFARQRSLFLCDVKWRYMDVDAIELVARLVINVACIRDNLDLAQFAIHQLTGPDDMQRCEDPPLKHSMMHDIAIASYPLVSRVSASTRLARAQVAHLIIHWLPTRNGTTSGRIFAHIVQRGFVDAEYIMLAICAADDINAMRAMMARGYQLNPFHIPVSDEMYNVARMDSRDHYPCISRDHVIVERHHHFRFTRLGDLIDSDICDLDACRRVIANDDHESQRLTLWILIHAVFAQHKLNLMPLLMERLDGGALPADQMYDLASCNCLDVSTRVLEMWSAHMVARIEPFSDEVASYFAFLIHLCMEEPEWDAARMRAIIGTSANIARKLRELRQSVIDGHDVVYPHRDYHYASYILISNMEQYDMCRDLRIPINWRDIASLAVEAFIRLGPTIARRIFDEMPWLGPVDAQIINSYFGHQRARHIMRSCFSLFNARVLSPIRINESAKQDEKREDETATIKKNNRAAP